MKSPAGIPPSKAGRRTPSKSPTEDRQENLTGNPGWKPNTKKPTGKPDKKPDRKPDTKTRSGIQSQKPAGSPGLEPWQLLGEFVVDEPDHGSEFGLVVEAGQHDDLACAVQDDVAGNTCTLVTEKGETFAVRI